MSGSGKKDPLAPLQPYFVIVQLRGGSGWRLDCKHCASAWSVDKRPDGTVHTGNILHLLDHAWSHNDDD